MPVTITVELTDNELDFLEILLADSSGLSFNDLAELAEHFLRHAADGVRRPGSWERGWLTQCTGWPPIPF